MKELSIEEKAKAYDEAKARMRRAFQSNRCTIGFMWEIFPELKESEYEKIRKWIINEIKIKHHNLDEDNIDFVDKAIAWLEHQTNTKVKDFSENREDLSEFYKQVCRMAASLLNKEHDYTMETIEWYAYTLLEYAKKELEKQGKHPQGKSAVEANNEVLHNIPVIVDADKAFYDMICEYFDDGRAMDKDETNAFKEWLLRKIKRTN